MKPVSLFALLLAGLLVSLPAGATRMYKIVDQNGNVTYTTKAPDTDDAAKIETTDISGGVGDNGSTAEQRRVASKNPVTLYTVENCPNCNDARSYLKLHGIPFTEKDVNKDLTARAELKQRSGALAVPTVLVGKQVLKGYVEQVLENELSKAGYPVGKNAPNTGQEGEQEPGSTEPPSGQGDQGDQSGNAPSEGGQ